MKHSFWFFKTSSPLTFITAFALQKTMPSTWLQVDFCAIIALPIMNVWEGKWLSGEHFAWGKPEVIDYIYFVCKMETRAAVWVQHPWVCCILARRHLFFTKIHLILGRPLSSPISYSLWSSWVLTSTIACFDISVNCARMLVMREEFGSRLPHCVLPLVFLWDFPNSCTGQYACLWRICVGIASARK